MPDDMLDTLVIGAGQAGLATGYHLRLKGLKFRIVEQSGRIGDSWRKRYDSLTLFTPRAFSALRGSSLAGDPDGYPSRDEFAAYLEDYARQWQLPVSTAVRTVEMSKDGANFLAKLSDGNVALSTSVVIATGGFQQPARLAIGSAFDASVVQLDTESYQNPASAPRGRILVVGDGASGRDIAVELASTHEALLAVGKPRRLFPERIFGRNVWWWLKTLGLMRAPARTLVGRTMQRADPFPDRRRNLSALRIEGVRVMPRLVAAEGRDALFADATRVEIDAVVWAVGYRDDLDWLQIADAKDSQGMIVQTEGVSPVPGLFFVGRPWQRNRASALVMGVSDDAEAIVGRIASNRPV